MIAALEWFGAATGILGALLLAANIRQSGWAFVIYVASCLAWICYAWMTGAAGMITMQIVFLAANLLGIYRWLVQPAKAPAHDG